MARRGRPPRLGSPNEGQAHQVESARACSVGPGKCRMLHARARRSASCCDGKDLRRGAPNHETRHAPPIYKILKGQGQIPALLRNPNMKGVDTGSLPQQSLGQLRGELNDKQWKTLMKHFEGRDLRHG